MESNSESETTTWDDPMETLRSDKGGVKVSPDGRQDQDRTKICPICLPRLAPWSISFSGIIEVSK